MPHRRWFAALAMVLVACGGGGDGKDAAQVVDESSTAAAAGQAPDLDACEILRGMDLSPYLAVPVESYKESIKTSAGSYAASMCSASPAGGIPLLTLMLRYGQDATAPSDIDGWIRDEFGADTVELGPEIVSDLRTGEVLQGFGDFGVAYELAGPRVSAYWNSHYHLTASANGFSGTSTGRQAVEAMAREAIRTLSPAP